MLSLPAEDSKQQRRQLRPAASWHSQQLHGSNRVGPAPQTAPAGAASTVIIGEPPPLLNDLLVRAVRGDRLPRVPLWLLRQAGPHLPEFGQLLASHQYPELYLNPQLACELTLLPVARWHLDAAPLFTDIALTVRALGLDLVPRRRTRGGGGGVVGGFVVAEPLADPAEEAARRLDFDPVTVRGRLSCVLEALDLARRRLMGRAALLGVAGAPWSLLVRMAGGASVAVAWLYSQPEACERLLDRLACLQVEFMVDQVAAGAQALQVLEPHAGSLTPGLFARFALPGLRRLAAEARGRLGPGVPLAVFAPGCSACLAELAGSGYNLLGVDHLSARPEHCRRLADNAGVALQGNLDPALVAHAPSEALRDEVRRTLRAFGVRRYVCNLGGGVLPETRPERVEELVRLVRMLSEDMRSDDE